MSKSKGRKQVKKSSKLPLKEALKSDFIKAATTPAAPEATGASRVVPRY